MSMTNEEISGRVDVDGTILAAYNRSLDWLDKQISDTNVALVAARISTSYRTSGAYRLNCKNQERKLSVLRAAHKRMLSLAMGVSRKIDRLQNLCTHRTVVATSLGSVCYHCKKKLD